VTGKTIFRQNRPNIPIEFDLRPERRRLGSSEQTSYPAGGAQQDEFGFGQFRAHRGKRTPRKES
jgi:hypothetical protein